MSTALPRTAATSSGAAPRTAGLPPPGMGPTAGDMLVAGGPMVPTDVRTSMPHPTRPGWHLLYASSLPGPDPFTQLDRLPVALSSLRVVQLHEIVRGLSSFSFRMSTSGRKQQVIDRIYNLAQTWATWTAPNDPAGRQNMWRLWKMIDIQFQYGTNIPIQRAAEFPDYLQVPSSMWLGARGSSPGVRPHPAAIATVRMNPGTYLSTPGHTSGPSVQGTTHVNAPPVNTASGLVGRTRQTASGTAPVPWHIEWPHVPIKPFPFFEPIRLLGPMIRCPAQRINEVRTARFSVILTEEMIRDIMGEQPTHAIYLVSTSWVSLVEAEKRRTQAPIAFPSSADLYINGERVSYSFRGSKKFPGRVGPPRLSKLAAPTLQPQTTGHLKPGLNRVDFYYRGASCEFDLGILWARVIPPEHILAKLKTKIIPKSEELSSMRALADDDDIVRGAAEMSLTCPLSLKRLDTPARSVKCQHTQCFDPIAFLRANEVSPTWQCPVCSRPVDWDDVKVAEYVQEIVRQIDSEVENVIIEPDGQWHLPTRDQIALGDDSDEDEDQKPLAQASTALKTSEPPAGTPFDSIDPVRLAETPPHPDPSRAGSEINRNTNGSNNRGIIDLTLESEDEEEAAPQLDAYAPAQRTPITAPVSSLSPAPAGAAGPRPQQPEEAGHVPQPGEAQLDQPQGTQLNTPTPDMGTVAPPGTTSADIEGRKRAFNSEQSDTPDMPRSKRSRRFAVHTPDGTASATPPEHVAGPPTVGPGPSGPISAQPGPTVQENGRTEGQLTLRSRESPLTPPPVEDEVTHPPREVPSTPPRAPIRTPPRATTTYTTPPRPTALSPWHSQIAGVEGSQQVSSDARFHPAPAQLPRSDSDDVAPPTSQRSIQLPDGTEIDEGFFDDDESLNGT